MSDESGAFGVTLKGQGQNDPWTTIRANTPEELEDRLTQFVDLELPELVAKTAAAYVTAHNNQPGISAQRDQRAAVAHPVGVAREARIGGWAMTIKRR